MVIGLSPTGFHKIWDAKKYDRHSKSVRFLDSFKRNNK